MEYYYRDINDLVVKIPDRIIKYISAVNKMIKDGENINKINTNNLEDNNFKMWLEDLCRYPSILDYVDNDVVYGFVMTENGSIYHPKFDTIWLHENFFQFYPAMDDLWVFLLMTCKNKKDCSKAYYSLTNLKNRQMRTMYENIYKSINKLK